MADLHVNGQPWQQQYLINGTQTSDITGWSAGTSLPIALAGTMVAVTIGRVFLLGGVTIGSKGNEKTDAIYTATIATDGTIGTWSLAGSIPAALTGGQAVYTKGRLYIIGGQDDDGPTSGTYYAPVDTDGTIGSWSAGPSLPGPRSGFKVIVAYGKIHLVGGQGSAGGNAVYTADISESGVVGSWGTGQNLTLDSGIYWYDFGMVYTDTTVSLIGGFRGVGAVTNVLESTINTSDGTLGAWSSGTSLPTARMSAASAVTEGRVFLIGGDQGSGSVSTVYSAPIDGNGDIGTWANASSTLASAISSTACFVTSSRIYAVGGWDSTGDPTSATQSAPFSGGINDYSGELHVATSGDVTGEGSVSPPLDAVEGAGDSSILVYGDGVITPPLCTVNGSGEATAPVYGTGVIAPLLDSVDGTSTVLIAAGAISPSFDIVSGQGSNAIIGWGLVRPKTTRFTALGISGVPVSSGKVAPPRETISGAAATVIVGWGMVANKPAIVAGSGAVTVTAVGTGRVAWYVPIVSSTGLPAIMSAGTVSDTLSDIAAFGGVGINGSGQIASQKHIVSSKGGLSAWPGVIQFERDQSVAATSPPPTVTAVSFSRPSCG